MPVTRIDREAVPYVRPAYEPDTRTLLQLMQMAGQSQVRAAAQRGDTRAQGLMTLGQVISQGLSGMRQGKEREQAQAFAQQQYQDEQRRKGFQDQLSFAQFEALQEERAASRQAREQATTTAADASAHKRGGEVADQVGYGPMAESQVDPIMQGPAAGRARYSFGPGTADGPELMPTREQQQGIETRKSIEAMGGTLGPNGQVVMPPKPEAPSNPTEWSVLMQAAGGDPRKALELRRQQQAAGRAPDNEPLATVIGPDGKPVYVRRSDAIGKSPTAGAEKPSSGVQKRVLNFFNRAENADKELEALEPAIQQMGTLAQGRMNWAPNLAQTPTGRQYIAAQRAFTEARLRKDSGAAIPPHEFESDRQTYFPQPGDDKTTLENKRRARAAILASLAFESGQALGEFLGSQDEAASVIQTYKTRSAKPITVDDPKLGAPLKPGQTVTIGKYQIKVEP